MTFRLSYARALLPLFCLGCPERPPLVPTGDADTDGPPKRDSSVHGSTTTAPIDPSSSTSMDGPTGPPVRPESTTTGSTTEEEADETSSSGESSNEDDGPLPDACNAQPGPTCDANGDVVLLDACGRPVELVEDCNDERGACIAGACGCEPGWTGEDCNRCLRYVDGTHGNDLNHGGSWRQAFATLPTALANAQHGQCEIWVAAGTYMPTNDPTDREATFLIPEGVHLRGGFAGNESILADRDPAANVTILSGDIDGNGELDDGNSRSVVTIRSDNVLLEGLTVTMSSGTAVGNEPPFNGALWVQDARHAEIEKCHITQNAVGLASDQSSVEIRQSTFSLNEEGALSWGSHTTSTQVNFTQNSIGLRIIGTKATINNSNFQTNNTGILTYHDALIFANQTGFRQNHAAIQLGSSSSLHAANCTFEYNGTGPTIWHGSSNSTVSNSIFYKNLSHTTIIGGIMGRGDISTSVFYGNHADCGTLDPSLTLRLDITNSILWMNSSTTHATTGILCPDDIDEPGAQYYFSLSSTLAEGGCPSGATQCFDILNTNPLFLIPDPAEGTPADLRLRPDSPCIDYGRTELLPRDYADLDGDGDTLESLPLDFDGAHRAQGASVDLGAFEHPG